MTPFLKVVSFAQPEESRPIISALEKLDYYVEICDSSSWLSTKTHTDQSQLVFIFRSNSGLCQEIKAHLKQNNLLPPFVVFLGNKSKWKQELLEGCEDFVFWPCDEFEIRTRLKRILEKRREDQIKDQKSKSDDRYNHFNLIGNSPVFTRMLNLVQRLASCDATVLIEGETGTGKEMVARSIHYNSDRKGDPFIPVNCGALPDELMENELFGHVKGAFTDAKLSSKGVVAQAEKGTLFLDEVEALSAKGQVALLRFLEEHEYKPVGSEKTLFANTRIVAATNKSLPKLIESGQFREDLYYRLNVVSIALPSLNDRIGDIEVLSEYFMELYRELYSQQHKVIHPETMFLMETYPWPGNVRELENFLHREFLLSESEVIKVAKIIRGDGDDDQEEFQLPSFSSEKNFTQAKTRVINVFEKQFLQNLMLETNGNVTYAARQAGKERRALGKLLKKHGIDKEEYA